jgi:hypothetical protein
MMRASGWETYKEGELGAIVFGTPLSERAVQDPSPLMGEGRVGVNTGTVSLWGFSPYLHLPPPGGKTQHDPSVSVVPNTIALGAGWGIMW